MTIKGDDLKKRTTTPAYRRNWERKEKLSAVREFLTYIAENKKGIGSYCSKCPLDCIVCEVVCSYWKKEDIDNVVEEYSKLI